MDPSLVWKGVWEVLTETAARGPGIDAVGVTSFKEECNALCEKLGRKNLACITGLNPHPMYSISKLMWIKKNRSETWANTAHVCLMADYIVYLLTGTARIDYALASHTMAFDIRGLCWDEAILGAAGIDRRLLSTPVPAGSIAGTLKLAQAAELGLSADTLLVPADHDQVVAAVGSGVFDEGTAVDGAGTVKCITPVFRGIPENGLLTKGSYAIVTYIEPDKYVCYAFSFTGGAATQWFVENLADFSAIETGK